VDDRRGLAVSRCFFHEFAPAGIRDCDGRVQNHHAIRQQTIRRLMAPARPHMMLDVELRQMKAALAQALRDPRNTLWACKRHHQLWHNGRIRVPRADVPEGLEEFAAEYELLFELDRMFGVPEREAA
jgi:hypothetical protein